MIESIGVISEIIESLHRMYEAKETADEVLERREREVEERQKLNFNLAITFILGIGGAATGAFTSIIDSTAFILEMSDTPLSAIGNILSVVPIIGLASSAATVVFSIAHIYDQLHEIQILNEIKEKFLKIGELYEEQKEFLNLTRLQNLAQESYLSPQDYEKMLKNNPMAQEDIKKLIDTIELIKNSDLDAEKKDAILLENIKQIHNITLVNLEKSSQQTTLLNIEDFLSIKSRIQARYLKKQPQSESDNFEEILFSINSKKTLGFIVTTKTLNLLKDELQNNDIIQKYLRGEPPTPEKITELSKNNEFKKALLEIHYQKMQTEHGVSEYAKLNSQNNIDLVSNINNLVGRFADYEIRTINTQKIQNYIKIAIGLLLIASAAAVIVNPITGPVMVGAIMLAATVRVGMIAWNHREAIMNRLFLKNDSSSYQRLSNEDAQRSSAFSPHLNATTARDTADASPAETQISLSDRTKDKAHKDLSEHSLLGYSAENTANHADETAEKKSTSPNP